MQPTYIYGGGVKKNTNPLKSLYRRRLNLKFLIFSLILLFTATVTSAQQLSFTVSTDTVFPNNQISIINTSINIPAGSHFRYSFFNGSIQIASLVGSDLTEYIYNGDTIECSISPFDSTKNNEYFSIKLELLDSLFQVRQADSFQINMLMLSSIIPLPTRSCHDPSPNTNQQWCAWNLICNGDFEWHSQCPASFDQLYYAEDWDGLSVEYYHTCGQNGFTPTTSMFGNQAPRSGDGMGGFYGRLGYSTIPEIGSVEAINVIFKEELFQQQKYTLKFYVARGTSNPGMNPRYATKIDALLQFSPTPYTSTPILPFPGLWTAWASGSPTSTVNQQLIFSNGPANSAATPFWEQHSIDFNPTNSSYAFLTIGLMSLAGILDLSPGIPISPGDIARYYIDDASLVPYPATVIPHDGYLSQCNGQTTLQVTGCQNVKEYRWYDPNMQLIAGANGPVVTLSNAILGIYTIEVENFHHCINTYSCELLPALNYSALNYDHWHPEPIIHGKPELCPVPDKQVYSIENSQPGVIYSWTTVPQGFTITPLTLERDRVQIDWSSATFSNGQSIEIIVDAIYPNCTFTKSTYHVFECCFDDQDPQSFFDITLTTSNVGSLNNNAELHGITTIDGNVSISGKMIFMGPGAKIIMTDNSNLSLDNSSLVFSCDQLWNGIFVQNPTQRIEMVNNSSVENAINGIFSRSGGAVDIENSTIRDCYIGVKIIDYRRISSFNPAPVPIQFLFSDSQIIGGYISAEPFSGNKGSLTYAGMFVKNVETLEIGSVTNQPNQIENVIFGVYGANIKVLIENNHFVNIAQNGFSRPSKAAVYAIFYPRANVISDAYKGDVIIGNNQFSSCFVGITSIKNKVYIHDNLFQNMADAYSVNVYDCLSPSSINQNVFSTGVKAGIYAARTAGVYSPGFEITDNNMLSAQSSLQYGIRLLNMKGHPLLPNSSPKIRGNKIQFDQSYWTNPSQIHFGIYADNCHNTHFVCNEVKRVLAGGTDYQKTWGMRISQTMGAQVYDNVFWKMGAGIYTSGDIYNTRFYCNDHVQSYLGYFFGPKTGLTNQGFAPGTSAYYPNGLNPKDEFVNVGQGGQYNGWKLDTDAGNIISPKISWYRYINAGPAADPEDNPPNVDLTPNIQFITQNNASNVCSNPCTPMLTTAAFDTVEMTIDEREALYYEILQAREYDELMEEYRMYDEEFLYTILASDTTLLWLGGENDQEYRDFYDSVKVSNVNRFYDIEKLIDSQVYDQAYDDLIELEPLNTIEANLKTAYLIYLNSWAIGRLELTLGEVDTLTEIAVQLPYAGGRGVYTARIMLGIEPFENELSYRLSPPNCGIKTLLAFPNPANQMVTFQFEAVPKKETALIVVLSISGREEQSVNLQPFQTETTLNLCNLSKGVYLVRLKYSNGDQASAKIIMQ
jgi:hypothetical protein